MTALPVIDVGPIVAGDASAGDLEETGRAIDEACREAGFFYVVSHGVPVELSERLNSLAREFFALPEHEKALIAMPRAGQAWRGWFPVEGELTSGVPDLKEGIYFGAEHPEDHPRVRAGTPLHGRNQFPPRPPGLGETVLDYIDALTRLGQAVLSAMAVGLGLSPQWFVENLTVEPVVLFRIFHYPPRTGSAGRWGVGEHTDYGLITLLAQDDAGGLQVRTPGGWVDAAPLPGSFVCNIGDMLDRLTGGRYRSSPHRVISPNVDRLSFPFFLDPSWDAVVDRLPIVARPADDDAAERWDHQSVHGFTGTYGEYLLGKVAKVFPELAAAAVAQAESST